MKVQKYLYVYILKCSDNFYYTGVTNNPDRRFREHQEGINKRSFTYKRRPLTLVYCERFSDFNLAILWEKRIKDWSRKKKEALINSKWEEVKIFSECKNITSHKFFLGHFERSREMTNE